MPFTLFDVALILLMGLSGLLAMFRGLSREILSIASWGLAAGAAAYMFKNHPDLLNSYIGSEKAAMGALVGGTFVVTLLFLSLVTMKISDAILNTSVSALDRTLGFFFGMARGVVLMSVAYIFYAFYFDKHPIPQVNDAYTRPFIESTSVPIQNFLVGTFERIKDRMQGDEEDE